MTSLKDLQDSFQKALLEGDPSILTQIPDSQREKKEELLGVYQYAYGARLLEFLQTDYGNLHGYLGDEQFEALCNAYIESHPSHTINARWFGEQFPAFVKETPPFSDMAQLGEIAALEYALNSVFDEVDERVLSMEQLAELPPEKWAGLVLQPVTAIHHLALTTNADEIWQALENENDPPALVQHEETVHILVFRYDSHGYFRPMPYEEAMMWDKMVMGVPFGVLCELITAYGGEEDAAMRAAGYLQGWIASGFIAENFKTGDDKE
ncbi:MAG: DNA-binding domain-containing protein [Hyphomicrobiaceae bacterium]|nr:DNA-binding domain-containing protein [Hyphomicrobiaceae bacterium]